MKRWIILLVGQVAIFVIILWPDAYTELRIVDILSLGTGYRAKEICSCLFVLNRTEEICQEWTKEISLNASYRINNSKKSVVASYQWLGSALPLFPSEAVLQDERRGCLLQR